jgi:hypothetical protein
LGDPRGASQPDTKEFDLYNQDIILLCSDGLCGTLRDNEIAELIKQHQTSMQECRDALWDADEAAGWTDNTTIALAQIISGGKDATTVNKTATASTDISTSKAKLIAANKRLKLILSGVVVIILLCAIAATAYKYKSQITSLFDKEEPAIEQVEGADVQEEQAEQVADEGANNSENNSETNPEKPSTTHTDNGTPKAPKRDPTPEFGKDANGKAVVTKDTTEVPNEELSQNEG